MTPQEIATIMRAIGRLEGTVSGLADKVGTQGGTLSELVAASNETRGAVAERNASSSRRAAIIGLGIGLVSAGAGIASYLVASGHS